MEVEVRDLMTIDNERKNIGKLFVDLSLRSSENVDRRTLSTHKPKGCERQGWSQVRCRIAPSGQPLSNTWLHLWVQIKGSQMACVR